MDFGKTILQVWKFIENSKRSWKAMDNNDNVMFFTTALSSSVTVTNYEPLCVDPQAEL